MRGAQAQGIVKPDRRGRMRRGPNLETFRGVDEPDIRAAQLTLEEVSRKQQEFVSALSVKGGRFTADRTGVDQIKNAIAPHMSVMPDVTDVGVMVSAEATGQYKGEALAKFTSEKVGGSTFSVTLRVVDVVTARALFIPASYGGGENKPLRPGQRSKQEEPD